jgi:hypothetical protein
MTLRWYPLQRERRVELYAESLKRIALSGDNDWRRFLLTECLEAYANLDELQRQQFQTLLDTEPYREARPLMMTTYERGKAEGKAEGKLEERREMALLQLDGKFGPLDDAIKQRVAEMTPEQLKLVMLNFAKAPSLKELDLED